MPRRDLIGAYNAHAIEKGRATMTETAFGRTLKKLYPGVDDKQRMVSGELKWCYIGIGLTATAPENDEGNASA